MSNTDVRADNRIARLFGITDGQPTERMARFVWRLLINLGMFLPETDRPGEPRGKWQLSALRHLLGNMMANLQGARQGTGKSFIVAILVCCFLMLGCKVAVAMPSLRQSSRILLRRILLFMSVLESLCGMKRLTKNALEIVWSNGAALVALSTDPAAVKGTQGYTFDLVVIDEAHEVLWSSLAYFLVLISVALQRGSGRIWLVGVAGWETAVSEVAKVEGDFVTLMIDDARIIREDLELRASLPADHPIHHTETWETVFATLEANMTKDEYDQFCRLIPPTAGGGKLFPKLTNWVEPLDPLPIRKVVTVDIGKLADETIVKVWEEQGQHANITQILHLAGRDYREQRWEIARFIESNVRWGEDCMPEDCVFEANGVGEVLCDYMADIEPFHAITRKSTEDDGTPNGRKTRALRRAMDKVYRGRIGCGAKDDPTHLRREREALRALRYSVDKNGHFVWPHHDLLTGIWLYEMRGSAARAA